MAKKFGKFLLFTAAVGTAAAAVYYYIRKKDAALAVSDGDDDYDDFSGHEETDSSRSYVPLHTDGTEAQDKDFTPLSEQAAQASSQTAEAAKESVEEFFDEDDETGEEPPLSAN